MNENKKKSAVIFGVGLIYSLIRPSVLEKYNIILCVDNNEGLWGEKKDGVVIGEPGSLARLEYDVVIIAASHIAEISRQLFEMGIPLEKIEVGANYVFERFVSPNGGSIQYKIDAKCDISCDFSVKNSNFINVNLFSNKNVVLGTKNLPALIALMDGNDRVPVFFDLSERFHGRQEGIFLDIGANIGTTSLEASEYVGVAKCIAFEPAKDTYALLMANIYLNSLQDKVIGLNYAVGDVEETNRLILSPVCSGDSRLRKRDHDIDFRQAHDLNGDVSSEDVQTIVIDKYLSDDLSKIKYVWIDVQGYEYFVLNGCKELLKNDNMAIMIEYWPHGLLETKSLDRLNDFLKANFTRYVDLTEYETSPNVSHHISEVTELAEKLMSISRNSHTDLFLLR